MQQMHLDNNDRAHGLLYCNPERLLKVDLVFLAGVSGGGAAAAVTSRHKPTHSDRLSLIKVSRSIGNNSLKSQLHQFSFLSQWWRRIKLVFICRKVCV